MPTLVQRAKRVAGAHLTKRWLLVRQAFGASADHACPACGRDVVGFYRVGNNRAWGCPRGGSSPRERLVNHLVDEGTLPVPLEGTVLHLAPSERSLVERFGRAARYVPADLEPERYPLAATQRLDLMELADTDRFDLVYASHVMEHVPDDRVVFANLFRALRPGGEAWLLVPLWRKPTEDGPADLSAAERERRYGQWDHVRMYGPDITDRIAAAGFAVETLAATDLPAAEVAQFALEDCVFRARKPA